MKPYGSPGRTAEPGPPAERTSRFLEALPRADAERLLRDAVHTELPLNTPLFARGEMPRYFYLLTSGMASVVYTSQQGNSIELSMIGDEGPVGWLFLLGPMAAMADCSIQVPGAGYRIPAELFQREFDTSHAVRARILEMAQQKALSAYQIAACNRLHKAGPRFARWLLTACDRAKTSNLPITQEFMGHMLGTRRTTVAEEAGALQRSGIIEYSRGHVRILDSAQLEKHACECYRIIKSQYETLYSHPCPQD